MPDENMANKMPMDASLQGDAALWQEVEYYMANIGNHTLMFSRASVQRMMTFLYLKAKKQQQLERRAIELFVTPRPDEKGGVE